jgi:LmbE family N-acetylglucosaminyl deacetylase
LGFAAFERAMWELLRDAELRVLFTPSITRELRRMERRIALAARRAARNSAFASWSCMPELDAPGLRPRSAPQAMKFLARLADGERPLVPAYGVAIVVVRPGDETLVCGATLSRLKGARLIVVTDGASARLQARGFQARAASRWRELEAALALAGLRPSMAIGFGLNEGEAGEDEAVLAGRFARQFFRDGTAIVLTPTDTDRAILRALAIAIERCARRGQEIAMIAMPRAETAHERDLVLSLGVHEVALKRRMLASFASSKLRREFYAAEECFRLLPAAELPSLELEAAAWPAPPAQSAAELQASA